MKDTNNKVDYNVWSGTDYGQNTEGLTNNYPNILQVTSNNKYSTNGENCISIKSLNTDYKRVIFSTNNMLANEKYILTADIFNPSVNNVSLRINEVGVGNVNVDVPMNKDWGSFSVSITTTANGELQGNIVVYGVGTIYMDNLRLVKS